MFDVAIIGAGVVGSAIARELSRYRLSICLIEKGPDVAIGTSKANSAIVHAGFDPEPGSLMAKTNVEGLEMFEPLCRELDVHFKRIGALVVAFDDKERKELDKLRARGRKNCVRELRIIEREELKELEPSISKDALAALSAPTAGITCPYELTVALAENAVTNGANIRLDTEVVGITRNPEGIFKLETRNVLDGKKATIECRCVVNAAGLSAGKISEMACGEKFEIKPRKGEYFLLDKAAGSTVKSTVFGTPSVKGKGVLITPTVDGNLLVGPNAKDVDDSDDVSTTVEGLEEVWRGAMRLVPGLERSLTITAFSGIRAHPPERNGKVDFIIENSSKVLGLVNVAGICSPGLSSSPAIAVRVVKLIKDYIKLESKGNDFIPTRKHIPRFRELPHSMRESLVRSDARYGRVVCRCETVTEAEVIEALHRPIVSANLDAIKRRVRAGMGRCQGGFCGPRIVAIISRELGISPTEVRKSGMGSNILVGKTKSVNEDGSTYSWHITNDKDATAKEHENRNESGNKSAKEGAQ